MVHDVRLCSGVNTLVIYGDNVYCNVVLCLVVVSLVFLHNTVRVADDISYELVRLMCTLTITSSVLCLRMVGGTIIYVNGFNIYAEPTSLFM